MDTLKLPSLLASVLVGGSFWAGFADVLSKASVPTTPEEFGKALAALALVLVPQAVQWSISRFFPKKTATELEDMLNQVVARQLAGHQLPPPAPAPVEDAV